MSIIKTADASVTVSVFDPIKRGSFRAFGTHLGDVKLTEDKSLSVYSFGNIIEIHSSGSKLTAEFDIKPMLQAAKTMLEA